MEKVLIGTCFRAHDERRGAGPAAHSSRWAAFWTSGKRVFGRQRRRRRWGTAEKARFVMRATGIRSKRIPRGRKEPRRAAPCAGRRAAARPAGSVTRRGNQADRARGPDAVGRLGDLSWNRPTRGDPQSPLRWTTKSTRKLAEELGVRDKISGECAYRRQPVARKRDTVCKVRVRRSRARHIRIATHSFAISTARSRYFIRRGSPSSPSTPRKKNWSGISRTQGRSGSARESRRRWMFTTSPMTLGKAIPYGVYDVSHNEGWVSVGIDHDTAQFAAATIHRSGGE